MLFFSFEYRKRKAIKPMENCVPAINKVTRSCGNVFKDIGLPNPEQHAIKAKTVSILAKLIEHSGMTQSDAAELIGIKQPDLSKLLRGNFSPMTEKQIDDLMKR